MISQKLSALPYIAEITGLELKISKRNRKMIKLLIYILK